ncbi:MAG: HlyD family efflux transporter periplasmic adaptor subunit [Xanthobacteraceae bacterium]
MSDLFRKEAVFHATRRLSGAVILATPLSVRLLGALFGGIVLAGVVFACVATYARKATVTGWLVPDQGLIRATVSTAGFIQNVVVKEGEPVAKGARLAEVRVATETATGNVGDKLIQQLRKEAEAAGEKARMAIKRLDAEGKQAHARLAKLRFELEQLRIQAGLQEKRVKLAREEATRGDEVAGRGLLSLRDRDARRQAALALEQEAAGQQRQIAGMEREISEIDARLFAIGIDLETAQAERQSAEATLEQRMIDAEARRVQFISSPVAGRIAALPVSVGQAVSLGATVAVVIPEGAKLEAELLAPSRAAGFIRPGQDVRLMLQAFPYQRFGMVKGEIKTISTTVLGPSEISIPGLEIKEPVFRIRVTLAREDIQAYGDAIPLQPGMVLSADIVFDRRSLIQWLFDPLFAVAGRS